MDYDSSNKFISSLAKFLQSLCNGYVEFDNGVQVIGHLYLSVDTGKTIDYILNEKVCKTDENSVTFISNSFHAEPAEKPKPQGKRGAKDSKTDNTGAEGEEEQINTNDGSANSRNAGPSSTLSGVKRPHSPSQRQSPHSKSGRSSPKYRKGGTEPFEQGTTTHVSNPASENSISSAPSPSGDGGPPSSVQGVGYGEGYSDTYFNTADEDNTVEESDRDVKPSLDTDVTFIKEEFGPGSGNQGRDGNQGEDQTVFSSNQAYSSIQYSGGQFGSTFGGQRTPMNPSSDRSSAMYSSGGPSQMESGEAAGDPSAGLDEQSIKKIIALATDEHYSSISDSIGSGSCEFSPGGSNKVFPCDICGKVFRVKHQFIGHLNTHMNRKPFRCEFCEKSFAYATNLSRHRRTCENNPQYKSGQFSNLSINFKSSPDNSGF